MPRTRTGQPRPDKEEQILGAAERTVLTQGVESLSVAAVARELGLAPNSIYWYFPSRDHLIVATARRILGRIIQSESAQDLDGVERILWFVDQMGDLHRVRFALARRARDAPVLAAFLVELATLLRDGLRTALQPLAAEPDLDLVVDAFIAVVHDTAGPHLSDVERRGIRKFALDRLLGSPHRLESGN